MYRGYEKYARGGNIEYMSALEELNTLIESILPVETGVFSDDVPIEYVVLTPLTDTYQLYADDKPTFDIQEVRISVFTKNNYRTLKSQLEKILLQADFTITDRRYIGREDETEYHHYCIDIAKEYYIEMPRNTI